MAASLLFDAADAATQVCINEIHYDNVFTDSGESIEIAGSAGTDLSGWSSASPLASANLDELILGFGFNAAQSGAGEADFWAAASIPRLPLPSANQSLSSSSHSNIEPGCFKD